MIEGDNSPNLKTLDYSSTTTTNKKGLPEKSGEPYYQETALIISEFYLLAQIP